VRALGVSITVVPFPPRLAQVGEWGAGTSLLGRVRLAAACLTAAWGALGYLRRLRRVVTQQKPDVVHSNGVKMHLLSAWVVPRGSAVVWHVHDYISRRTLTSRALRAMAGRCRAVVANSDSVARDLQHVLGRRVDVHRVWNAVDLERYSSVGPVLDLDRLAGLPSPAGGVTRVGLVATFARWKGHAAFLRALSLLPETLGVRGYIVGGPMYTTGSSQVSLDELQTLAGERGLAGRVGFVGYVPDTAAAMRALDVVVHASTEPEPFGLVIAEAMACRRAVVASAGGGAAELIEPGVTALSHEPGDVTGLADRIRMLVSDAALRARLASAAREAAERAFGRARMVGELLPVYRTLAPRP
jgi:glycosyltransferase involved in cell wall biosynthesis